MTYFQNLSSRGQKEFWKAVKLLNKQDSSIPTLTDSTGVSIYCLKLRESILINNFFLKCFNHDLPPLQVSQPLNLISCPEELLCSVEEIGELLYSLQPDKSIGFDGVSLRMLKSTACSIAPSLTKLFNHSIASGIFPEAIGNTPELFQFMKKVINLFPLTTGQFQNYPL